MFLSRGDWDLGVAFQIHPGSQASSLVEAKNSALLSSRDRYLLKPPEWPKGSQASFGVGQRTRDCSLGHAGNEGPHLAMTGVPRAFPRAVASVWGFPRGTMGSSRSLSCGSREVRSPMRVARGSASLLSNHGRGIGARDASNKDSRGLSWVAAGSPGFPRLVPVSSGSFSGCL